MMIMNKILKNYRFLSNFFRFERNVVRLAPVFKSKNLSTYPLSYPKLYFVNQYVTTFNEERNDISRGHSEVTQSFICFKYLRLIKNAVREAGPIVEENQKLSEIIQNAQKNNLSPEYIDFAINIACNLRGNVGLYDLLLGNGCHFVIQYEDIDQTITKHHLLNLCEKYEATLIQNDSKWPQNFDQKGIISVRCYNPDPFTGTSKEVILSKIGAETLHKDVDAEGLEYWKIYCDPWLIHDVKENLSEITANIEEAFVGYVPQNEVTPSHTYKNAVYNILIELRKVPTIDNVFHNVSYPV